MRKKYEKRGIRTIDLYNDIVEMAGSKVALEMFKRFNGEVVAFSIEKDHPFYESLKELAGKDIKKEFQKKYGGTRRYVGLGVLIRKARNEKIRELFDGTNSLDLAKRFDLSLAMIGQVINGKYE